MINTAITADTPITYLTVGQLTDYLRSSLTPAVSIDEASEDVDSQPYAGRRYVYGIKGIMELFQVSNMTAQKYKRGILKDAVTQVGRNIRIDVELAEKLYREAGHEMPKKAENEAQEEVVA